MEKLIQFNDGRLGAKDTQTGKTRLLSPTEVQRQVLASDYYDQQSEPYPTDMQAGPEMTQSPMGVLPRGSVEVKRRTMIPEATEKTKRMRGSLTPQEYILKKTFERPGYLTIEDPVQSTGWIGSVLVPAGDTQVGRIKITGEFDFEVVKIMTLAKEESEGTPETRDYLVFVKEGASERYLSNLPIHAKNFGGDANEPLILPNTLLINRNCDISVEFTNLSAANAIYVYFTLLGTRYLYPSALNLTTGIPESSEYKRF